MYSTLTRLWLAVFCMASLCLSSCKKGSISTDNNGTKLLTSAPWKATTVQWQTTAGVWVDETPSSYSTISITLTFYDNNTYAASAGPISGSGTWQLSSDNSRLTMTNTSTGSITNITVSALTSTTLQFSTPLDADTYTVDRSGPTATYTYYTTEHDTYTH